MLPSFGSFLVEVEVVRRASFLPAIKLLVVLGLLAAVALPSVVFSHKLRIGAVGGRGESKGGGGPVALLVWEVNNGGLRGMPLGVGGDGEVRLDPVKRVLTVRDAVFVPPPGSRLLVVHRIDSLDTPLYSRLIPVERFPASVPIERDIHVLGVAGNGAEVDVVENRTRLTEGRLEITGLAPDGTVSLTYNGETIHLHPGQSWGVGWAKGAQGKKTIKDDDQWAAAVGRHLEAGEAITVLTLINFGPWPGSGMRPVP